MRIPRSIRTRLPKINIAPMTSFGISLESFLVCGASFLGYRASFFLYDFLAYYKTSDFINHLSEKAQTKEKAAYWNPNQYRCRRESNNANNEVISLERFPEMVPATVGNDGKE